MGHPWCVLPMPWPPFPLISVAHWAIWGWCVSTTHATGVHGDSTEGRAKNAIVQGLQPASPWDVRAVPCFSNVLNPKYELEMCWSWAAPLTEEGKGPAPLVLCHLGTKAVPNSGRRLCNIEAYHTAQTRTLWGWPGVLPSPLPLPVKGLFSSSHANHFM